MPFQIIPIPALQDNYIWLLWHRDMPDCVVIDPGEARPVIRYLVQHQLSLSAILVTHHHWDHTNGIEALLQQWPVPVFGPSREVISGLTHPLKADDQIKLLQGRVRFNILEIPGHTRGHIAYYGRLDLLRKVVLRPHSSFGLGFGHYADFTESLLESYPILFCGDTLFTAGCGRLFEGTAEQMYRSLMQLRALPDKTQIYCGHEYTWANLCFAQYLEPQNPAIQARLKAVKCARAQLAPTVPSLLREEKLTNPFLRCDAADFVRQVRLRWPYVGLSPIEIFKAVRQCKDNWIQAEFSKEV